MLGQFIRDHYREGIRYMYLLSISGTWAVEGLSKETLLSLYDTYLKSKDDENRRWIIHRTFDRYLKGESVKTLLSGQSPDFFRETYKLIRREYSLFKAPISSDKDLETLKEQLDLVTDFSIEDIPRIPVSELSKYVLPISEKQINLISYLEKRGIPRQYFRKYNIFSFRDTKRLDEVALVAELDGEVNFITSRYISNTTSQRYMNIFGKRSYALWSSEKSLSPQNVVFLCEGVFDAIVANLATGCASVAVFSNTVSKWQFSMIRRLVKGELFICFDHGTYEIKRSLGEKMLWEGVNKVYVVPFFAGLKDVSEVGVKEFVDYVERYAKRLSII